MQSGELLRRRPVPAHDPNLVELPFRRQCTQMRRRLRSRAEDRQHGGVSPGHEAKRDRAACGGSHLGRSAGVKRRERHAAARLEDGKGPLQPLETAGGIGRAHADDLHAEEVELGQHPGDQEGSRSPTEVDVRANGCERRAARDHAEGDRQRVRNVRRIEGKDLLPREVLHTS